MDLILVARLILLVIAEVATVPQVHRHRVHHMVILADLLILHHLQIILILREATPQVPLMAILREVAPQVPLMAILRDHHQQRMAILQDRHQQRMVILQDRHRQLIVILQDHHQRLIVIQQDNPVQLLTLIRQINVIHHLVRQLVQRVCATTLVLMTV